MRLTSFRWLLVLGGVVLGSAVARGQASTAPKSSLTALLKASRWQKRVLLLCAPTATDDALLRQRQLLAPARADLAARDLLVQEVLLNQVSPTDKKYLTENLRVSTTGFTALLIGKDGGAKRRETEPVAPSSLFSTIDVMPMRQQEMRKTRRQ
ncbi:DUF4174 domain-containing protein [Hymenobacter volaticus]|uniref:DUF4174 domain-containing protein n=1 Tax=Hymenobacter volaticus TaxID=2932254 RepID=A0ABY4G387_9BACT|nr:DUF4174 domain-containing protein [Hymenobacter volaticus]UOQ65337.1 DUF4174 domain-containing protein [Hymenobacter volaticus]